MATVLWAIGLVLIVEGLAWALAPSSIEKLLDALRDMPVEVRRLMGLIAVAVGVILLWLAQNIAA